MSVNKVILVGNVGKDPEVRHLDEGVAVANFSLATTERGYTTRAGAEVPERTEWHNIVAWRGLATLAEKYIRKGMKLYIEGKIRTRSWEDQNGVRKYTSEIFADNIELPKRDGVAEPAQLSPPVSAQPAPKPTSPDFTKADAEASEQEGPSDDLPF